MGLDDFFNQQKVVFNQRLKKHKSYLAKPLDEAHSLLDYDEEQIAGFETMLYITFLYHDPEKLKFEQEELRKAKELKEKISKKALELSLLLREFHDVEIPIENDFSLIFSLDLIQEAGKRIYAKNGTRALHVEEAQNYRRDFIPALEKLSKNINVYYSCPNLDELIFELHQKMKTIAFIAPDTRQPSARSMVVKFYQHLMACVADKLLAKAILDIPPDAVADLINIVLDLEPDARISGESAGKAINKARQ